jgi:hypothetical protein
LIAQRRPRSDCDHVLISGDGQRNSEYYSKINIAKLSKRRELLMCAFPLLSYSAVLALQEPLLQKSLNPPI